MENNIDDKIRRTVDYADMTVGNRMHDAILTAMDKVVIPRVEMAVRLTNASSGHGPNSEVQNRDRRGFSGNVKNTPLMSVSSRIDFKTIPDGNDGTRNEVNFEDGDFPVLGPNYDRRAHVYHNILLPKIFLLCCPYGITAQGDLDLQN